MAICAPGGPLYSLREVTAFKKRNIEAVYRRNLELRNESEDSDYYRTSCNYILSELNSIYTQTLNDPSLTSEDREGLRRVINEIGNNIKGNQPLFNESSINTSTSYDPNNPIPEDPYNRNTNGEWKPTTYSYNSQDPYEQQLQRAAIAASNNSIWSPIPSSTSNLEDRPPTPPPTPTPSPSPTLPSTTLSDSTPFETTPTPDRPNSSGVAPTPTPGARSATPTASAPAPSNSSTTAPASTSNTPTKPATTTPAKPTATPTPTSGSSPTSSSPKPSTTTPGATPAATTTAPKANIAQCANPYKDRWGVKFRYQATSANGCTPTNAPTTLNEWYLTLLPAMRSVIPNNGGMDVPGALPGLQFQIRSNIAKHKIPGFQPLYQHLGVDSIIITLVGTFTGDGGLGSTYDVQSKTSNALSVVSYLPWDQGQDPSTAVNPIWNEIVPTHNRAARGTVTLDANGNVVPATYNPYNANTGGAVSTNGIGINDQIYNVSTGDPNVFMIKDLTRNGMWNRDGCPGDCEPYNKEYDAYSPKDGSLTMNNPRQMLNKDQDVFGAYTLRELAAYNDSYHEFISFYKMAIHEARELEIEINLRRNSDGLNPQVNQFLQYGRDAVGYLRNDQGNPAFKGVVKNMRVFHARSDRTWYSMEIEVTDYGMAGGQALNLTKRIEDQAKKALEASLAASRAAQSQAERELTEEFFLSNKECFIKANNKKDIPGVIFKDSEVFYGRSALQHLLDNNEIDKFKTFIDSQAISITSKSSQPKNKPDFRLDIYRSPSRSSQVSSPFFWDDINGWGRYDKPSLLPHEKSFLSPIEFINKAYEEYSGKRILQDELKVVLEAVVKANGVVINTTGLRNLEVESKCSKSTPSTTSSNPASTSGSSSTTSTSSSNTPSETRPTDTTTTPDAKPADTTESKPEESNEELSICPEVDAKLDALEQPVQELKEYIENVIQGSLLTRVGESLLVVRAAYSTLRAKSILNTLNDIEKEVCTIKQAERIISFRLAVSVEKYTCSEIDTELEKLEKETKEFLAEKNSENNMFAIILTLAPLRYEAWALLIRSKLKSLEADICNIDQRDKINMLRERSVYFR